MQTVTVYNHHFLADSHVEHIFVKLLDPTVQDISGARDDVHVGFVIPRLLKKFVINMVPLCYGFNRLKVLGFQRCPNSLYAVSGRAFSLLFRKCKQNVQFRHFKQFTVGIVSPYRILFRS